MEEDTRLIHVSEGIVVIKEIMKYIKEPADKASLKQLKDSLKTLEKKYKMLKKDENLRVQYLDRTCYDVVQGIFQTFHLYIISTDGSKDEEVVPMTLSFLRLHDTAYEISKRMQAAAEKRADFAGGKK